MKKSAFSNRRMATFAALCATTAIIMPASAIAQEAGEASGSQEAGDSVQLKKIIIGYSEEGNPIYAGDNTTHLDQDDIKRQGGTGYVDDILRQQTSTFTNIHPGNPGIAVNIRGFEGNGRVAMAVDGVPQNYRFSGHAPMGFAYVDENLLTGIDITRGSHTTAGGNGIAGSVNFRTIGAGDIVDDEGFGGLLRVNYGENADEKSGMGAIAYKNDRFDVMAAISGRDAGNFFDAKDNEVTYSGKDIKSGLAKASFRPDDRQEVSVSAMHYATNFEAHSYEQDLTNDTFTFGYRFDGDSP